MKKPIRVFYSELSGRFYASQHYQVALSRNSKSELVTITGAKYDVTDDIGAAVTKHDLEFTPLKHKGRTA